MKERIRVALKWDTGYEGEWLMLGVPDEIWDQDPEDSGIWTCLIATTVAIILERQPEVPLQNRKLRITDTKKNINTKGREAIIRSIEHGRISGLRDTPFKFLRIEKSNRQETGKQQGAEGKEQVSGIKKR